MKQRGRKSADAIIATAFLPGGDAARIEAGERLTQEQAIVFAEIVESVPGAFFSQEQAPLVCQLARHIISARRLAIYIDNRERLDTPEDELADYFRALGERRKETAAITSIMRALRLTNQSRYRPERAANAAATPPRPWES